MAAPTTVLNFAVGQRLKASALNLLVTAVGELQPPSTWTTGTIVGTPTAYYAYRIHGWLADVRMKLVYSSAPSSLTLNVTAIPVAAYPQSPGGSVNGSGVVLCYGSIGASGTREALPCFLSTGGTLQVRGGATNPNNWDTFEVQATYSVA
jgi:hypothetical protein